MTVRGEQQCNVCGSALRPMFARVCDTQTGEFFGIDHCVACGLGHTVPQPANLARYYGPRYHGGRHGMTDRFCVNRRLRFAKAVGEPGTLLDFGCGDGAFLNAAAGRGWHGVGVEMQPAYARAKGFTVTEDIDEATGGFDLITAWHSLEHVRSPRKIMQSIAERLSPVGHVIVAVPNLDSLQSKVFAEKWFHLDVPRHLFHFTPNSIQELFRRCGLIVTHRWNLESEQDLFGWTQGTLNRIIPHPNVLFDVLTRRGNAYPSWETGVSLLLGTAVTILAAPIVPLSAAVSRGAVMVFAAKKADTHTQ